MINKKVLPKAYAEVLEILKFIPKEDYDKVPNYIIENMQHEMDSAYMYELNFTGGFENQKLLKETEAILAVFYRDYWATDEQKQKIKEIEVIERKIAEEEKIRKYESKVHIKKQKNETNKVSDTHETALLKTQEQGFWRKLFNNIKNIIKK